MTRLAILADIHGNMPALDAVITDMQQYNPDHVIVLGDLINGAPFDSEVVDRVMNSNWATIRGNHELFVLNLGTERARPADNKSKTLQWVSENVADWLPTLASLPDSLTLTFRDGPLIRVEHGIPGNPNRALRQESTPREVIEALADVRERTFLHGHHHIPYERTVADFHIIDPGSVGLSQNGVRQAYYAILDSAGDRWEVTQHAIDYDFEAVAAAFEERHILDMDEVAGRLKLDEIRLARQLSNPFRDWFYSEHGEEATPTLEHVEQFMADRDTWWRFMRSDYRVNENAFKTMDINP
jgi:predicted phosphodiesterase